MRVKIKEIREQIEVAGVAYREAVPCGRIRAQPHSVGYQIPGLHIVRANEAVYLERDTRNRCLPVAVVEVEELFEV